MLAAGVLIHHLYQASGLLRETAIGYTLQAFGYWMVADFFFLSGYGLTISYQNKGIRYTNHFVKNRILPFYMVEALLIIIYAAKDYICTGTFRLKLILQSFLFGGTIIGGGWYLQMQLLLYILWFLVYRTSISNALKRKVVLICILTLCVGMNVLDYAITWYGGILLFYLGILWAENKEKVKSLIDKWASWIICLFLSAAIFFSMYVFSRIFADSEIGVVAHIVSMVAFSVCITSFVCKISLNCNFTRFLGSISFEIYATQFLFLDIFRRSQIYNSNIGGYILCVVVSTVITSLLLHPIVEKIYYRYKIL